MISQLAIIIATVLLFLFAVSKFSRSIERVAGNKMKYYLTKATETPARGAAVGFTVNAVIQSGTALTVTLVGLVNAGLVTFPGALGIIIGSNVGNVLTSQLVAFNIVAFAPVFIVIGFLMKRFHSPVKHYAGPVFYFGLLFLTLSYLQLLITPYASNPGVLGFIQDINSIYIAIAFGIVGAAILQSSGAVTVLAITFAVSGILNFDQAFGIVVGSSIGTTVTALIASIVMNTAAQKTAFAHLWFNVVSAIITILLFSPVKNIVLSRNTPIGQSIANAHLIVCAITGIFLLVVFRWYMRFIDFVIPEKGLFHRARKAIETSI